MDPKRRSSLPPPEVAHAAAPLAADSQVLRLQTALVHALQYAARLQDRAHAAESELRQARRELARSKADAGAELRAMRLELLATQAQCWALHEVCRALLLTIEQAACSEVDAQPLTAGVSP